MITTIFLDNDGVLVDTEKYYFEASRIVCERLGFELTAQGYRENFLLSNTGMAGILSLRGFAPDRIREIRAERDAVHADLLRTREIALPGVSAGLAALSAGFRLCMVTSSPRSCLDIMHGRTGYMKYFDAIVCEGMVAKSKPHPEPYLLALSTMDVDAWQGIAIEDSQRGMRSALDAGLRCIVIPRELTRDQDFSGALAVLGSFDEAVNLIRQISL
ncbi:MAG: HAD family phosphatase [Chitinispirillaceae bacterium]|nr:HAD family phosphatase [Chitinispirillaceae bacterium]